MLKNCLQPGDKANHCLDGQKPRRYGLGSASEPYPLLAAL